MTPVMGDLRQKGLRITGVLLSLLTLAGLYYWSQSSTAYYLLFHTLIEFFSVAVAAAIFSIGWHTRQFARSNFLLLLAIAYLCVGLVGVLHTLAFKGMGVFPGEGANLPTQLWVAARLLESVSFVIAALLLRRRNPRPLNAGGILILYLAMTAALLAGIIPLRIFPACFLEPHGLTPFKNICEYMFVILFIAAGILIWQRRALLERRILLYLLVALGAKIISELCFTRYIGVYDSFNALGHIFMLVSTLGIYLALIEGSLRAPYQSLFRDLAISRDRLEDELEERITAEEERERLLVEVARHAAEIDATVASLADGLIMYSPTGDILQMNDAARTLLGYGPGDVVSSIEERLDRLKILDANGDPIPIDAAPPVRALHGETVHGRILVVHALDGQTRWVSASAAPIATPDGNTLGAVVTFTDITALHTLQEQREAEIHILSHDLRAPLTIIKGHVQLMQTTLQKAGISDEIISTGVEAVLRGVQRMNVMIQDMVDAALLQSGQLTLKKRPVDMGAFLADLLRRAGGGMDFSRITLTAPPHLPPVAVDGDRMERVLMNLLTNALKYSPPDSPVQISAEPRDAEVVVAVRDQGVGISAEDLPHIFDRFYRAKGTRKAEGLGLGLHIASLLAEAHQGRLRVESTPGEGSTFYLHLPAAEKE
ncbi:MAG: sensor histidine kinase [Armatimonadota bacterium]